MTSLVVFLYSGGEHNPQRAREIIYLTFVPPTPLGEVARSAGEGTRSAGDRHLCIPSHPHSPLRATSPRGRSRFLTRTSTTLKKVR